MNPDEVQWYEVHANLHGFACVLVATYCYSAEDLLGFLEKPWKWTAEFRDWDARGRPSMLDEEDDAV